MFFRQILNFLFQVRCGSLEEIRRNTQAIRRNPQKHPINTQKHPSKNTPSKNTPSKNTAPTGPEENQDYRIK